MEVLVTGGAGYIGSVMVRVLAEAGYGVRVLDDLSTGHADALPAGVALVEASLFDTHALHEALEGTSAVMHFAARSLVGESVAHPERYWHTNVAGSHALLEGMRAVGVGHIVFSSTAATYGEPELTPIVEDAPTRPTNPYGASKLAVDHMLASYARAHSLGATSLRYFNVAGSYAGARERHASETHLIPLALAAIRSERGPLAVFGDDYPTPDGTCVRDYIHVRDLAEAHLRALATSAPGTHRIVNLGSGTGYSVAEVLAVCGAVTGVPVPTVQAPRREGDPAILVASHARARDLLDWEPTRALEDMVRDAWEALPPVLVEDGPVLPVSVPAVLAP